jgi:hypothetical protein
MQVFVQVNTNPPMVGGGGKGGGFRIGNPLIVFTSTDVQHELKLTDDQKTKITKIVTDTEADVKEVRKGLGKGATKEEREEATKKTDTLNKDAMEKIAGDKGILTADQKKIWKDLPGEKFEIKFEGGGGGKKKKDN